MSKLKKFCAITIFATSQVFAESPRPECSSEAISALEARVHAGDARAQFWLGTQLETGRCGTRDSGRANDLLHQAAAQGFPPALHVLGIMLRRSGKDAEALKYFERSAQLGYPHGFADLGFTYGLQDSPVRDPIQSYAWLTLAIARSTAVPAREYLEATRAKISRTLTEDDLARAKNLSQNLRERFATVPGWVDSQ